MYYKTMLLLGLPLVFFITACHSQKKVACNYIKQPFADTLLSYGKISHKYISNGCSPIIISYKNPMHDTLTLIPMNSLNEIDKDGKEVLFNFKTLKVHQPKGCGNGIPVYITTIRAK